MTLLQTILISNGINLILLSHTMRKVRLGFVYTLPEPQKMVLLSLPLILSLFLTTNTQFHVQANSRFTNTIIVLKTFCFVGWWVQEHYQIYLKDVVYHERQEATHMHSEHLCTCELLAIVGHQKIGCVYTLLLWLVG